MANWQHKIGLNAVLGKLGGEYDLARFEEDCPEPVKTALIEELDKAPPLRHFCKRIKAAQSIAAVNRILNDVYDVADRELVWCGLCI